MNGIVVVADHSLPMEDTKDRQEIAQRRSELVVELVSRLGAAVKSLVLYSETARLATLTEVTDDWMDYVYGSNMADGLAVARRACADTGVDRIALVTSSTPSAHNQREGDTFFCYPPVAETLQATAAEGERCAAAGLRVDTLALGGFSDIAALALASLTAFLEEILLATGGQVIVAPSSGPVDAVVEDFLVLSGLGA